MKKEIVFLFSLCFFLIFCATRFVPADGVTGEAITGNIAEGGANASITFYDLVNFTILSPENKNYTFSTSGNVVIDLNISLSGSAVPTNWTFTLVDLWLNVTINSSAPFTPNASVYPNRRLHNLTVSVQNEIGVYTIHNVEFYIDVNNTAPVISIPENELFACEDETFGYSFNVSDAEDGGIDVGLTPIDPFYIYPLYFTGFSQEIDLSSVVLDKTRLGTHQLVISASDGESADSKKLNITVIETNAYPEMANLGTATIWAFGQNTSYYKEAFVYDSDCDCNESSGKFNFNLTFLNNVPAFFNVTRFGIMSFVANESMLGPNNGSVVYNLSLCAIDQGLSNPHPNISICGQTGFNLTTCKNFSITITAQNRAPQIVSYSPASLSFEALGTETLHFNVSELDLDGTAPDTYWYVDGNLLEVDVGSSTDQFDYAFGCGTSGLHTVEVETTDGSNICYGGGNCNASLQWVVVVDRVDCSSPIEGGGSGGGGGGGGGGVVCIENWVCDPFQNCENADESLASGRLSGENYRLISESCNEKKSVGANCGFQLRNCQDVQSCGTEVAKPFTIQSCYFTINPTCFDGIKNCHDGDCEFMTDCGGTCNSCPTCSDGKQNQAEEGVDCGGPCPTTCQTELPQQPARLGILYLFIGLILLAILLIKVYQTIRLRGVLKKINEKD